MKKKHTFWTTTALLAAWLVSMGALCGTTFASESTADHSKFKELDKDFQTGPEVTKACLSCHTEAAKQVHKTAHWTWDFLNPENKQRLGKKNVLNNFCIAPRSNFAFCTACHVGYGWKDENFDFTSEENVDCLACHDTTGGYSKPPGKAGHPDDAVNLKNVAQNVGKTSRDSCGSCHFFGGGGDGVKHGDLDSSLAVPDDELDIHMDALGLDFTCATCHATSAHQVPGSRYAPTAKDTEDALIRGKSDDRNPTTCQACHGNAPHAVTQAKLNSHANKIACQTCHIPTIARGGVATKMSWDWSTAGKLTPEGKPVIEKDEEGHVVYHGKKGNFTYGANVAPEYVWFNGKVKYTLLDDKINVAEGFTPINHFEGSPDDGESRIWPVKVFRGMQPYDPVNMTLVIPHTAGKDDTAYWANFNWEKAIASGMQSVGAPFSGKVDFIRTEMMWPITHMVAPADKALSCEECHSKDSRLQNIEGIYMPGRDASKPLNFLGWALVLAALIGVLIHGAIRIVTRNK
jgi:octaheme c-type cytochrome (tetrathionate reductase family)